jgi:hypothetical protein
MSIICMLKDWLDAEEKEIDLNGHKVIALVPKKTISYEEAVENIKRLLTT